MQEIVYHTNYELEDKYWWFVARNLIIKELTGIYSGLSKGDTVLDVGCGTGGFAKGISDTYNPVCMDTSGLALDYCKRRGLDNLFLGLLKDFPKNEFDIKGIFMLDVLEHIEDDKDALGQVNSILPAGGAFIISVPAYKWLWSRHDVMHMHYRRYTKKQLNKLLESAGFEIVFSSYLNTLLFLPAVIKRFLNKLKSENSEYQPVDKVSPMINNLFERVFRFERRILRVLRFPFGLSILTIAIKSE